MMSMITNGKTKEGRELTQHPIFVQMMSKKAQSDLISRRSVVATTGVAAIGGVIGLGTVLSPLSRDYPVEPGSVTITNYHSLSHTVSVMVTKGPTTPHETVTIDPEVPTGEEDQPTITISDFLSKPGLYNIQAVLDNGSSANWTGVQIWTEPNGTLGGQVPEIQIRPDGSADIALLIKYPPPDERS